MNYFIDLNLWKFSLMAALSWDREGSGGDGFCGENVHRRQEAQTRGLGSRTEDNACCSILGPEQGARRRAGEGAHAQRDGDRAKARQLLPYFAWLGPVLLSPKWSVLEPSHCPPSPPLGIQWDQHDRETRELRRAWGSGMRQERATSLEQHPLGGSVHHAEGARRGPEDVCAAKCGSVEAKRRLNTSFWKSVSKLQAQNAFSHVGSTE